VRVTKQWKKRKTNLIWTLDRRPGAQVRAQEALPHHRHLSQAERVHGGDEVLRQILLLNIKLSQPYKYIRR
jgi:hypothetical protein